MFDRTEDRFGIKLDWIVAETAYGSRASTPAAINVLAKSKAFGPVAWPICSMVRPKPGSCMASAASPAVQLHLSTCPSCDENRATE